MKTWIKKFLRSLGAFFGVFPEGGIPKELDPKNRCQVCNGEGTEEKLLEASNNLHMRCPACGRLIRPH